MNNDKIAEQLALTCEYLREDLKAERESSTYWYREVQGLKKELAKHSQHWKDELAKMTEQYKVATNHDA